MCLISSCSCVCMCLWVNHNDVTWLGVKVDQSLPCVCHQTTLRILCGFQHFLSYGATCRIFAKPVIEVLLIEAAWRANLILSWVESMKILVERWIVTGLQTRKQYVIFSVFNLFGVSRSFHVLVNLCNAFMCRWIVANHFIYYLYAAGKRNRNDCVGGNGGGFFGCFVS